mmetsp:Transcript_31912/g.101388  ORF Transcript_31912/g.101388 Transcript_31912/m.101388 type:complete len:260 (-) Transcript_31912:66-845(-)
MSGGTFGKMSHQVASLFPETVPVAEPPMASTRGNLAAVFFMAPRIKSQWYSGSGFVTSHSVSIDSSTSLSCTATVLMSLLPRSKAKRQPEASLPQTCFLSPAGGSSLALATILTGKGSEGVPQTFGIVLTSKAYLPPGEKASATSAQSFGGPQSKSSEALRCQIISWMQTPARCTEASRSGWLSASTGSLPRAQQPSARGMAHSKVKGLPPSNFMYRFFARTTGQKFGSRGAGTFGRTSKYFIAALLMAGSGGPCAAPT